MSIWSSNEEINVGMGLQWRNGEPKSEYDEEIQGIFSANMVSQLFRAHEGEDDESGDYNSLIVLFIGVVDLGRVRQQRFE